jgi:hypothetical protein
VNWIGGTGDEPLDERRIVVDALCMAIDAQQPIEKLIHHSDRGCRNAHRLTGFDIELGKKLVLMFSNTSRYFTTVNDGIFFLVI